MKIGKGKGFFESYISSSLANGTAAAPPPSSPRIAGVKLRFSFRRNRFPHFAPSHSLLRHHSTSPSGCDSIFAVSHAATVLSSFFSAFASISFLRLLLATVIHALMIVAIHALMALMIVKMIPALMMVVILLGN
ncbi:unnamed protein product [Vicia faba]|uniref:Uncharacterized protein n=1 Tax=Vicia faba TaxID=3906 RepID=A0AAV0ZAA1_VICFA|nr:unnamed protein product [Vicia faba]